VGILRYVRRAPYWNNVTKSLICTAGMAVNLSYALGIHKQETFPIFDSQEQTKRSAVLQPYADVTSLA